MPAALALLVGSGRWVGWYVALWLTLVPALVMVRRLRAAPPGAGPGDGTAAFVLLGLFLAGLTVVTFVNATLLARTLSGSGARRYALALVGWLVLWPAAAAWLAALANRASVPDAGPAGRRRALAGFVLLLAATYAANLAVLARARGHASAPRSHPRPDPTS